MGSLGSYGAYSFSGKGFTRDLIRRGGSAPVRAATFVTGGTAMGGGGVGFRALDTICLVSQIELNFESSSGASMKLGAFMPASLKLLALGNNGKLLSSIEGAIAIGNEFSTHSYLTSSLGFGASFAIFFEDSPQGWLIPLAMSVKLIKSSSGCISMTGSGSRVEINSWLCLNGSSSSSTKRL